MTQATTREEAVVAYLKGLLSLEECLLHFPGLSQWLQDRALDVERYERMLARRPDGWDGLRPPRPPSSPPDLLPRGLSALAILAAPQAGDGFDGILVHFNGHALWQSDWLFPLCTDRLRCTFFYPGLLRIQAKTLFMDSIIDKVPRLESNIVEVDGLREPFTLLRLDRTPGALRLLREA